MTFDPRELLEEPASWLSGAGPESEIVLSSRVRIARNLAGHRFTHHCDNEELAVILGKAADAARRTGVFRKSRFVEMGEISTVERQFLAERHLV